MVIRRLTDRLVALVAFLPVGLGRLVATAFGLRRGAVVPLVAAGLVLLGLFPLAQAGVELITHQATPGDVIERRAGDLTMLEVAGIGFETGLPAGTDTAGRPMRWLALRDAVDDRRVMLVRTPVDDGMLRIREVVGRVTTDAPLVASATTQLADRGVTAFGDPATVAALDGRVIAEVRSGVDSSAAQRIDDPGAITGLADGTLVRVRLRFTGAGIAICTLDGSCDARRLATGGGVWALRAVGLHSTQSVLVTSTLPPSAVPVTVVGRQVRDPAAVDAMLATAAGRTLLGWSRALDVALLDHDPALPADRVWGGALLLVILGLLLVLGRPDPLPGLPARGRRDATRGHHSRRGRSRIRPARRPRRRPDRRRRPAGAARAPARRAAGPGRGTPRRPDARGRAARERHGERDRGRPAGVRQPERAGAVAVVVRHRPAGGLRRRGRSRRGRRPSRQRAGPPVRGAGASAAPPASAARTGKRRGDSAGAGPVAPAPAARRALTRRPFQRRAITAIVAT